MVPLSLEERQVLSCSLPYGGPERFPPTSQETALIGILILDSQTPKQ